MTASSPLAHRSLRAPTFLEDISKLLSTLDNTDFPRASLDFLSSCKNPKLARHKLAQDCATQSNHTTSCKIHLRTSMRAGLQAFAVLERWKWRPADIAIGSAPIHCKTNTKNFDKLTPDQQHHITTELRPMALASACFAADWTVI